MEKQFVTIDIAVDLYKLGFDDPCLAYFELSHEDLLSFYVPDTAIFCKRNSELSEGVVTAPLWQQAYDWLIKELDKHYPLLYIEIFSDYSGQWIHHSCDETVEFNRSFNGRKGMIKKTIKILTKQTTWKITS